MGFLVRVSPEALSLCKGRKAVFVTAGAGALERNRLLEEKMHGADRPVKEQEEIWRQQNGGIRTAAFVGAGFPVENLK